jgi:DNA-3-methyladenine glycosylase II
LGIHELTMRISNDNDLAEACRKLRCADKRLAEIINHVGPCTLKPHTPDFHFLADAIIGQQIATKAAATISARFKQLFKGNKPTAKGFLNIPKEEVLSAGVSGQKYGYILDLAQRINSRKLRLASLSKMSDSGVREKLTEVKGIGVWTADMFLLFGLGRLDVFPLHDFALRQAMARVYDVPADDHGALLRIANRWAPYRSVGTWYMYRSKNAQQGSQRSGTRSRARGRE